MPIIGTDCEAIRNAEDRGCFETIMEELRIPQPEAEAVTDIESGVKAAARIGYPVLVRPSYVLGGRAMQIVSNEERLRHYLQTAVEVNDDSPVLVDRYIMGKELEVDAICDGKDVFIPGIMEHVERTGIHSGDSISVYPTFSVSQKAKDTIIDYTVKLGLRHRHHRSLQYPVHPRRQRRSLRHRGQSPLVAHGAVPLQIDGRPDGPYRHAGDSGQDAEGTGRHRSIRHGEETLVRQGAGLLVLQDPRHGCLPLA